MEVIETPVINRKEKLNFFGDGASLFGILALNLVLTILTLGLYYPWAKEKYRKYLWNEGEFKHSRFVFHGTGKEMFKGFVIAYAILISLYIALILTMETDFGWIFILLFYVAIILISPLAIFGTYKYQVKKTSWRGIFFSFDGNFKEFFKIYMTGMLLTLITFGIYFPWLHVKLRKYLLKHTKIGELKFDFFGEGEDLFVVNLVGGLLSYITLFLYFPIYKKDRFNFFVNNTSIQDGTRRKRLNSTLTNSEAWNTLIVNALLLIVTLGLAFPWTFIRSQRMFFGNIEIPNEFDFENLSQADQTEVSAVGDSLFDALDLDF